VLEVAVDGRGVYRRVLIKLREEPTATLVMIKTTSISKDGQGKDGSSGKNGMGNLGLIPHYQESDAGQDREGKSCESEP